MSDDDYMNTICDFYHPPKEEKEPETIKLGSLVFTKPKNEPRRPHGIGQCSHTTQGYYSGAPFYFRLTSRIEFCGDQSWSLDERTWHKSPREALLDKKKWAKSHYESLQLQLAGAKNACNQLEAVVALMEDEK